MEEKPDFEKFELYFQEPGKDFLKEIAKWTSLLAILGFIAITVLFTFGLFAFTILKTTGVILPGTGELIDNFGTAFNVFYLMLAGIFLFPVYFLFQFSSNVKKAFKNNDSEALIKSLKNLKSHYKWVGITSVLILVLCILLFLEVLFP